MSPNINPETGIRYGVIDARNAPILFDEIVQNGTDLSFKAHKEECAKIMARALEECGQRDAEKTAKELVEDFEWDHYECDEPSYEYEDEDGNKFHLSHLGGAPLIWCIQTNKNVQVRSLCSPCVPNAGDLDSGIVESGVECYGVPDDYIGKDA